MCATPNRRRHQSFRRSANTADRCFPAAHRSLSDNLDLEMVEPEQGCESKLRKRQAQAGGRRRDKPTSFCDMHHRAGDNVHGPLLGRLAPVAAQQRCLVRCHARVGNIGAATADNFQQLSPGPAQGQTPARLGP